MPRDEPAAIESGLSWADLAEPGDLATAWTCLFRNLEVAQVRLIGIRAATSSFGQAAVNMAVNAGAKVIATTRTVTASRCTVWACPGGSSPPFQTDHRGWDDRAVLDLVGNSTMLDSLAMLPRAPSPDCGRPGESPTYPLADASGATWPSSASFVFGSGFPSDVPLQAIAADVEAGRYRAKPSRVFRFEDIREVHRTKESNEAIGKLV